MTTTAPTIEFLQELWKTFNGARASVGLQKYSFQDLATLASSADAIPGEAIKDLSRATVYAVMRGSYSSSTAPIIRQRLAHCINVKIQDLLIAYPAVSLPVTRKAPAKRRNANRTPRIHRIRCTPQGYINWRNNTYYLGRAFACEDVTISPLRDRSHGIRVTIPGATRDAYPVDPANNQLGYEVRN